MRLISRYRWRKSRFMWTPRPIRRCCETLPNNSRPTAAKRGKAADRAMASVTNTYARAFAEAVFSGHHDPDKTLQEARAVAELVAGSKELRAVWETPSITADQKRAVLDAIAARQGISRTVRNFVAVLIDHRRITFLGPIVKQFEQELNQRLK